MESRLGMRKKDIGLTPQFIGVKISPIVFLTTHFSQRDSESVFSNRFDSYEAGFYKIIRRRTL